MDYLLRLQVRKHGRPGVTWVGGWGALVGPASPHTLSAHQESISDFYWYYSGKDVIEEQGKRNFSKAMSVAKQVFNSLTEYIQVGPAGWGREGQSRIPYPAWRSRSPLPPPSPAQGPCTGNQQSLAHSRLWDAVVGFLHVFAHMMMKLAQVRAPLFFIHLFPGTSNCPFPSPAPSVSFSSKGSRHVPDWFPPRGLIHLPSGLALCMTPPPPLPPPIGWFPIHTSIGLTFGPRPLWPRNSSMIGWCSFFSDVVISDSDSLGDRTPAGF